jgi:hypothetical protein
MTRQPTVLAVLLRGKGQDRYGSFRASYDKAARRLDPSHGSSPPSRAQFHRWLTGDLRTLPYPDHCRVLEHMLAGYSARQLFQPCPTEGAPAPAADASRAAVPPNGAAAGPGTADLAAVFASRSDFASHIQPQALLEGARAVRAAGLSLNLICQQVPDQQLMRLLTAGTHITCLFLDPRGEAIKAREHEEDYPPGQLSALTGFNIDLMTRLRDRLPADARDRLHLAVYDTTIRFNIVLVDDRTCIMQPYLPHARGIDAPTFLIQRSEAPGGLYPTFEQVYESLREASTPV